MIKLLRVDDRLLHGQVSLFWTEYLNLSKIIVINNEAAYDDFTKMILNFAKPKEVILEVIALEDCESVIDEEFNSEENSIIITGNMVDVQYVCNLLKRRSSNIDINIGGLRVRPNSIKITDFLYLSPEDIHIIFELIDDGVGVYVRRVPKDENINVIKFLNR